MGILDTILENSGQARVVSEQHDTRAINWARGLSDPGEMIRCGYMPELRRRDGESDSTYQARLETMTMPDGLLERIKTAALQRASLNTTAGKVSAAFAGRPAWHGLGTVLDKPMSSHEAMSFAHMDWPVIKKALSFDWDSAKGTVAIPTGDSFAIVRGDTGQYLGTVGSRYQPIQNVDSFAFLDGVIGEFGAKYESAGALYNGQKVWLLAHFPSKDFAVNGDEMHAYVAFVNCHDGTGAAWAFPTNVRVECANTTRTAMRDKGKGLSIRHTGNVKDKILSAQEVLGLAMEGYEEFRGQAETLAKTPCNVQHYASDVLDAVLEVTAAQAKLGAEGMTDAAILEGTVANTVAARELAEKSFARKIERREGILDEILSAYESERCHPKGTAWSAFNSITEVTSHSKLGKESRDEQTRLSRRFESILSGERDEMAQVAFNQALALAN